MTVKKDFWGLGEGEEIKQRLERGSPVVIEAQILIYLESRL